MIHPFALVFVVAASQTASAAVFKQPAVSNGSQPAKPARDGFVYTDIAIGTPPQTFTVMVLSTVAYAWVPDSSCICPSICGGPTSLACLVNSCDGVSECCGEFVDNGPPFSRGVNPEAAPIRQLKVDHLQEGGIVGKTHFNFSYLDAFLGSGFMGYDTVQLGELSVSQAMLGQASNVYLDSYQQGVIGFGPSATLPKDVESPDVAAFNNGLINQPIASLWWDKSSKSYELSYGGVDAAKCGAVKNWHNISADTDGRGSGWFLTAVSVRMGNTTVKAPITQYDPFSKCILQTSDQTMLKLLKGVGIGLWEFNCSISFNLTLTIDGQQYVFPSAEIVVPSFDDKTLCMLDINGGDGHGLVIGGVGGVATRFYQALDIGNNRFGFAPMLPN